MSYSSLVDYVLISPNSSNPRKCKIDKITIHHMAGSLSVEECGEVFKDTARQASANYAIDNDCRVGLYVDESNRSWASSSSDNDNRAITIELANDVIGGDWHVSDSVISKCIELCVDICIRNDIEKLIFTGDSTGNLTMHQYFTNTECPGPYLKSKFSYIAEQVNTNLHEKRGELTMTQYEELLKEINVLKANNRELQTRLEKTTERLCALCEYTEPTYDYVDVNMPMFAHDAITKLINNHAIEGELNLSYNDLRIFTILDRLNVVDNSIEYISLDDIPDWGKDVVSKLMSAGVIKGDGNSLGITEQTVKLLVYLDRMNIFNI